MSESKTSKRRLKATERHLEALELRKQGKSFPAIAEALGYRGPSGAYKAVMSALDKMLREPAEEVRKLEAERLDTMFEKLWGQIKSGNHGTIDKLLKVMDRRAKLLGLDAPSKRELTGPDGKPLQIEWVNDWRNAED